MYLRVKKKYFQSMFMRVPASNAPIYLLRSRMDIDDSRVK